ncbi:MAG: hypothetical protein RIC14_00630 [Filomicrobium sp.]
MRTPLLIQTALACRVTSDPMSNVPFDWFSEPAKEARDWMRSEELLDESGTKLTERGVVWVEAICNTPLPVKTWVMPDRN